MQFWVVLTNIYQ